MSGFSDGTLVERARAGDELAFRWLLERHRSIVHGIALNLFLPGGDRDDLLQEARVGFHKAVRDWRPGGAPFRNFAGLCVRRHLATALKAANRHKHEALSRASSIATPINGDDGEIGTVGDQLRGPRSREPDAAAAEREAIADLCLEIALGLTELEEHAIVGIASGMTYAELTAVPLPSGGYLTVKQIDLGATRARAKLRRRLPHVVEPEAA